MNLFCILEQSFGSLLFRVPLLASIRLSVCLFVRVRVSCEVINLIGDVYVRLQPSPRRVRRIDGLS